VTHNVPVYQPAPVINYPNEHLYTRVTEFKYLTGQEHAKTSIVYEFPQSEGDPYYPVPRKENAEIYAHYKALANDTPGVHFVGRLATYKYYNMDQIVAQALTVYSKMNSVKRKDALVMVSGIARSGNGNGNGNGKARHLPSPSPQRQPLTQT
jgi:UDP-galactopyranose mutase